MSPEYGFGRENCILLHAEHIFCNFLSEVSPPHLHNPLLCCGLVQRLAACKSTFSSLHFGFILGCSVLICVFLSTHVHHHSRALISLRQSTFRRKTPAAAPPLLLEQGIASHPLSLRGKGNKFPFFQFLILVFLDVATFIVRALIELHTLSSCHPSLDIFPDKCLKSMSWHSISCLPRSKNL